MQIKAIQFSKQAILDLKTLDASVSSGIKRITNQLSQQDFSGIKKIKKSNPPLFRARVQNLRVFFDYYDGEIRILSVLKRNERTYKNIPLPSFFREFQNVSLDALECEDVDYLSESYYEYDGLPKYRLTSENLPSQEEIEAFIESKYQFFPVLDREQEEFISMVMNNPKVLWSIRGAAGSGKSLVMMELAMNIANFKGEKVLIFVPNRRLVERYMDFLTRVNEEKILDPRDISFNNSIEKFLNDEQHKILVSDIYTFMQSIAKMKKFSPQDIKEALKERMKYSNNKKLKNADMEIVYELVNYFMIKNKKISMKNNLFAEYRDLYENLSKELNADKYKALKRKINKADHSDLIDLATKKIEKITVPHSRKFHIFIDEVQDFSEDEFQFLFELYEKLNKKEDVNFTFCGDTNQAVRLNGFEFGKMMRIISSHGFNVKKKDFKKNYRTSRLISQAANYLVKEVFFDVFKKENGKKIENIVDPNTVIFRGARPRIAVSSTKTIKEAFSTISGFKSNEKPILIVEDASLKRLFPKGLNASDAVINISPSECKGLEFDKITLLDLLPNKPSHYNVSRLYTSLTRARFDAFLIEPLEKFDSLSYKEKIKGFFDIIKTEDPDELVKIIMESKSILTFSEKVSLIENKMDSNAIEEELIIKEINDIVKESSWIGTIERLCFKFFDKIKTKIEDDTEKLYSHICQLTTFSNYELKAIRENYFEHPFESVKFWKKAGNVREAKRVIDKYTQSKPLETIKASTFIDYQEKIEEVKERYSGYDYLIKRLMNQYKKDPQMNNNIAVMLALKKEISEAQDAVIQLTHVVRED